MRRSTKVRLIIAMLCILLGMLGVLLILHNLEQYVTFFYEPSQVTSRVCKNKIRVGGLIKPRSIVKLDVTTIQFLITDNTSDLTIRYTGVLPKLFRENQGVVAYGSCVDNVFTATELLTKHDESYRPPDKNSLDFSRE